MSDMPKCPQCCGRVWRFDGFHWHCGDCGVRCRYDGELDLMHIVEGAETVDPDYHES